MTSPGLDIIPDLHGNPDRLRRLFGALGRDEVTGEHPEGRRIAFLGDLIDRGPRNLEVVWRVKRLLRDGPEAGLALMGNHELNALLFHTPGRPERDAETSYLRAHTRSNIHQHQTFLNEAPLGSPMAERVLEWMLDLPLFHEEPGLRLVHACWNDDAIATIKARRPDGRIREEDLEEIAWEETDFAKAVVLTCKGPEAPLPPGSFFDDGHGHRRDKSRLGWWRPGATTWHQAVISVPNLSTIENLPLPDELRGLSYPQDAPPVLFGHYQLRGTPQVGGRALCLNHNEVPVAYRWDGEQDLAADRLLVIGHEEMALAMEF